jgi:hypothetical protein
MQERSQVAFLQGVQAAGESGRGRIISYNGKLETDATMVKQGYVLSATGNVICEIKHLQLLALDFSDWKTT